MFYKLPREIALSWFVNHCIYIHNYNPTIVSYRYDISLNYSAYLSNYYSYYVTNVYYWTIDKSG